MNPFNYVMLKKRTVPIIYKFICITIWYIANYLKSYIKHQKLLILPVGGNLLNNF
jgi:hypothetical protein